jgi:class 3 adenylate cyclase
MPDDKKGDDASGKPEEKRKQAKEPAPPSSPVNISGKAAPDSDYSRIRIPGYTQPPIGKIGDYPMMGGANFSQSPAATAINTTGSISVIGPIIGGSETLYPRGLGISDEQLGKYHQAVERSGKLEKELSDLRGQYSGLLAQKQIDAKKLAELEIEIKKREKFRHLLSSVGPGAQILLLNDDKFAEQFEEKRACRGFVMSVDIRRSTELMLKATQPELFAKFITTLCVRLRDIVWECHGLFDKFTGDGILVFFPEFYSGKDAGYLAVLAAEKCHQAFAEEYAKHRPCFQSVIKDAGLGIGIDLGETRLVSVLGNLTVVGTPVVYACRLGGAPPGQTLLNQQAKDHIFSKYSAYSNVVETEIEIKHEGKMVAYRVELNAKKFEELALPAWLEKEAVAASR